jgi:hypothetical protein
MESAVDKKVVVVVVVSVVGVVPGSGCARAAGGS